MCYYSVMDHVSKVIARSDIKKSIKEAVLALGGFDNFIKTGDRVLIKPNYNTADPSPASTAFDFLKAVVELVFECGAKKVIVGESSTFTIRNHVITTRETLEEAGVFEIEKHNKAFEVMIFDEQPWVKKEIPEGKHLRSVTVPQVLFEVDKIILLPVAKTHFIASYTGALKLAIGFMFPRERIKFHLGKVQEKIAEINTIYKPNLIIMDARQCFITQGPSKGTVRKPGFVLASKSRVAIDVEEIKIIQSFEGNSLAGKDPEEIVQIKRARELGID